MEGLKPAACPIERLQGVTNPFHAPRRLENIHIPLSISTVPPRSLETTFPITSVAATDFGKTRLDMEEVGYAPFLTNSFPPQIPSKLPKMGTIALAHRTNSNADRKVAECIDCVYQKMPQCTANKHVNIMTESKSEVLEGGKHVTFPEMLALKMILKLMKHLKF